jgi:hypothetical protein
MDSASASGRGLPLQFVAIFLDVLTDLVGAHGTGALLRRAGHPEWISATPRLTLDEFASAESITALFAGLEDLYGTRGSRGLGRRLGAGLVERCLKDLGALAGLGDASFQALPGKLRARVGTLALGRVLTGIGVPAHVTSTEQATTFSVPECPFCYGRSLETAGCMALVGLVEANLRLSVGDMPLRAEETACRGTGGVACQVTIPLPSAAG